MPLEISRATYPTRSLGGSLSYSTEGQWISRSTDPSSVSRLVFITKNARDIQSVTIKCLVCCNQSEDEKKDLIAGGNNEKAYL